MAPNQKFCRKHGVEAEQYRSEYTRLAYLRAKNAAYAVLGEICSACGFSDRRALNIDHKYGGGTKARNADGNYLRMYRDVVKHPENYQILCCNDNWIKRIEHGEVASYEFRKVKS